VSAPSTPDMEDEPVRTYGAGAAAAAGARHRDWTPGSLEALGENRWLVLGGGGLKGLSHVGAWEAFEEIGLGFSGIIGTSIGSLIGACVAGGMGWKDLVPLALSLKREDIIRINRMALLFNGIKQESLFHGDPLRNYIERILPVKKWSELKLPLQINAVNLATGHTEWFGTGANEDVPMVDAIYASSALPVFYPPAQFNNGYYVDGGAEYTFPLQRAAALGASGIVGVDVGAGEKSHPPKLIAQGMLAIHHRIFGIMSYRTRSEMVKNWSNPPLLFVRPNLDGFQTFDFHAAKYFLEEGYRATRAALVKGIAVAP
jgi:NTE family protein